MSVCYCRKVSAKVILLFIICTSNFFSPSKRYIRETLRILQWFDLGITVGPKNGFRYNPAGRLLLASATLEEQAIKKANKPSLA